MWLLPEPWEKKPKGSKERLSAPSNTSVAASENVVVTCKEWVLHDVLCTGPFRWFNTLNGRKGWHKKKRVIIYSSLENSSLCGGMFSCEFELLKWFIQLRGRGGIFSTRKGTLYPSDYHTQCWIQCAALHNANVNLLSSKRHRHRHILLCTSRRTAGMSPEVSDQESDGFNLLTITDL